MARWALVTKGQARVNQVAESNEDKFEVSEGLEWIQCGEDVTIDFEYVRGEFVRMAPITTQYTVARKVGFGDVGQQLGAIYDAMAGGADAQAALAEWAENQRLIKILFPKDNDAAMQAAHDEVVKRQDMYYDYLTENNLPFDKQPNHFALELAKAYVNGDWVNPISGPYVG